METKICTKCNIEKPVSEFQFRKDTGKYRTQCKKCENELKRNWAIKNKNKVIESRKKYEENNKEKIKERRKIYNEKRRDIVYDLNSYQVCTKCNIEKPITDFSYDSKKNYYVKICKTCKCEYTKAYKKANAEKVALAQKRYRENNKEKLALNHKIYRENNKEKIYLRGKKYRENKKEEIRLKKKIYAEEHKEEIAEKQRIYRKEQERRIKEYKRQYFQDNKERLLEKNKKNYEEHKEERALKQKEYYQENRDVILIKRKEYRDNNPQIMEKWRKENKLAINKNRREYYAKRIVNDPLYKFELQIRNMILMSFKRRKYSKKMHTYDIIGLEFEEFYNYLMETFKKNYGYEWDGKEDVHIDHIIPLSTATTEEEIIKLCHYTNLQLLKPKDNIDKKAHLDWEINKKS